MSLKGPFKNIGQPPKVISKPKPLERSSMGLGVLLYGPPGVGKTSTLSYFPRTGFVRPKEELGILLLLDNKKAKRPVEIIDVADYEQSIDAIYKLADHDGVKNIVIDGLTQIEKYLHVDHCRKYYNGDFSAKGFLSYQQGPRNAALVDLPRLLNAINDAMDKGKNVWFVGHAEIRPFNNPDGPDFDRWEAQCSKATWSGLHFRMPNIWFMDYDRTVNKEGGKKAKAGSSSARFIYTEYRGASDGKSTLNVPPFIMLGSDGESNYKAIQEALSQN